ncbi:MULTISPECIES: substrate-binding domain-containing protein [Brevibacterium]|uniref:ABC transporter substrate-binding protein n=1 Tax=Brevibacterium aurantiacum TaxID=273384 RepID=A0A4Z0KNB9_BREAU|nr:MULTISPECIES: hypothetical protein [Brevibacterium]TGD40482.1 hypothetical protein EB834_00080 [Brevibacterium aurantiacum]
MRHLISTSVAVALIFALCAGCGSPPASSTPARLIAAQSVAPLLPVAAMTAASPDEYEVELGADPDFLRAQLASGSADVAVLPTEAAAALYNGGLDIVMLGALDLSLLHVVGPANSSLDGLSEIAVAFPGDTADHVSQAVFEAQGLSIEFSYETTMPDVLAGLASGASNAAVLPEHFASLAVAQSSGSLAVIADLRDEWEAATKTAATPQIAIVASTEYFDSHRDTVDSISSLLEDSFGDDQIDGGTLAELAALADVDRDLASAATARLDAVYLSDAEARDATSAYLAALIDLNSDIAGGRLPDDGFYAS